jgi:methionyl aminopeptidase
MVAKLIEENGATCSFYKYNGFPGHICISINEELIHGVPTNRLLKKNDMVTFDIGVTYKNHICDAAFTIVLDEKNSEANNINKATLEALENAIYCIKPGNHIGDISYAIEKTASKHGYEVIKDFGGHGCGNYLHEDPIIYCFGKPHTGTKIVKGMVLCIEPMFLIGTDKYIIDKKNK